MPLTLNLTKDWRVSNPHSAGLGRVAALAISICAGAFILTACTPEAAPSDLTDPDSAWQGGDVASTTAPNSSSDGVKNIAMWALPLDEYVQDFNNLDNYSEQLLLASCLNDVGIEWPVPWQDVEEPASPVYNAAGKRLFNLEIAKEYGFRPNLAPSKSAQLWEEFLTYSPTEPGFQDAFDKCLAGIRAEHPILQPETMVAVTSLIIQVREEAFLSPEGQKAANRWRACMEPQGFGQLPDNPDEFPSFELLEELGSTPPVEMVEPSEREIAVAVAHATCLDSSDFSKVMYEMEWELQETAIERERANLDRIRGAVQARETAVREIIAANAPQP